MVCRVGPASTPSDQLGARVTRTCGPFLPSSGGGRRARVQSPRRSVPLDDLVSFRPGSWAWAVCGDAAHVLRISYWAWPLAAWASAGDALCSRCTWSRSLRLGNQPADPAGPDLTHCPPPSRSITVLSAARTTATLNALASVSSWSVPPELDLSDRRRARMEAGFSSVSRAVPPAFLYLHSTLRRPRPTSRGWPRRNCQCMGRRLRPSGSLLIRPRRRRPGRT